HGNRQRTTGALRRSRAGEDFCARSTDPVHSDSAARPLSTHRTRLGKSVTMPPRQYTLWISARKDSGSAWFLGGLALIVVVVPILNLAVPASSAFHISPYGLALIGKYLCYALLALAVDLIWGYCGILSLGHAAFFALGGYAM